VERKKVLSISFPGLILLVIALKYRFYPCAGWEQVIAIPIFMLAALYPIFTRVILLTREITSIRFKFAIISDVLFSIAVLSLPAITNKGDMMWPCMYDTPSNIINIMLFGSPIILLISFFFSALSVAKNLEE
jgi:hypothetical protein